MPELPEVETIKNFLLPQIQNKVIDHVDVLRPSQIVGNASEFSHALRDETFLNLSRYGKYLFFHFTHEKVVISHLRMEGKYYYLKENEPLTVHARVVFYLKNKDKLVYDDSRCFGILKLTDETHYMKEKEIAKLGKEPFTLTVDDILGKLPKNGTLKGCLLDQEITTGIGNIYADEISFDVGLRPDYDINLISKDKWNEIILSTRRILTESIKANGSTIRSYHPTKEKNGGFQNKLKCYGHADDLCPNCGNIFRKTRVAGRGTTYCPLCQRRSDGKLLIALTGPSACGKSTVLKYLKSKGYPTLSSDLIVSDLYSREDVIEKINDAFNQDFIFEVDKSVLKELILNDPRNKTLLESIIHPLVKEEINKFVAANKGIIVVEVPLLFESNMQDDFDLIIAVNSSKQDEFLAKREKKNAKNIKKINANNKFDIYSKHVDLLIQNDGTKEELFATVDNYFSKVQDHLNHKL